MKTRASSPGDQGKPTRVKPSRKRTPVKTIRHPALPGPLIIPPDDGQYSHDELTTLYWSNHPRFHFLKMSPVKARFFDIGAGWGRLSFWRDWLAPLRRDLEMHGCDLYPAQFADQYASFHVMDIDGVKFPYPDGFFGAAISSHVIEHLRQQGALAAELNRILQPGAMVYLETPTEESCHFPGRDFFVANGCPTTTLNFSDDRTHTAVVSRQALRDLFLSQGFTLQEAGTIKMPYLENALLAKAVAENDQELGSYGLWSKLGFAHYAVFQKPLA